MLQFDLQFYEELTVARVKTVKFISGAFFWPTGQLVKRPSASSDTQNGPQLHLQISSNSLT